MKKYSLSICIILFIVSLSVYYKLDNKHYKTQFEEFNPLILSTSTKQYSRFSGEQTQLSGIFKGTGNLDVWTFLHFPTGKYSTAYFSGNEEIWVLILQDTGEHMKIDQNQLTGNILQNFYKVSHYQTGLQSTLVGGDRGGSVSIFELPYRRNRPNSSTLIAFLSKSGRDIFRELSNKEIILVNKSSIVEKHIKGSNYKPDFAGINIEGNHPMPLGGIQHKETSSIQLNQF